MEEEEEEEVGGEGRGSFVCFYFVQRRRRCGSTLEQVQLRNVYVWRDSRKGKGQGKGSASSTEAKKKHSFRHGQATLSF